MSAFLGLTDAVRDALLASPALAGGNVKRGRNVPMSLSADQGIDISAAASRGQPLGLGDGSIQWDTTIVIVCKARADATGDAESALDPLLVSTWQRLLGMTLPPGVSGIALEPAIQWDGDEADQPIGTAALSLRITHITTTAALAAT